MTLFLIRYVHSSHLHLNIIFLAHCVLSCSVTIVQEAVCSCTDPSSPQFVHANIPPPIPHTPLHHALIGCLLCCMHQPQPPPYHLSGSSHPWYVILFSFLRWNKVVVIIRQCKYAAILSFLFSFFT